MSAPREPFPQLPHAAPVLLLDRVIDVGERSGVFVKLVTAADPLVAPDGTLPAAFVIEALAQAGAALLQALAREGWTAGYLAGVDGFEMRGVVRVGDTLRLEVEIKRHSAGATMFSGRALVDETVVAEGRVTLAVPR